MAIELISRDPVIKKDNTFLQTQRLVNEQKAVAEQLKMNKEAAKNLKIQKDREQNEADIKKLVDIGKVPPKATKLANSIYEKVNNVIHDQNINDADSGEEIVKANGKISLLNNFFTGTVVNTIKSFEDVPGYDKSGLIKASSNYYLDEKGNITDPEEWSESDYIDHLASDMQSYDYEDGISAYLDNTQALINKTVQSALTSNGAGLAHKVITEQGKLMVMDEDGIAINEEGEPTMVISPNNFARFKSEVPGAKLWIDEYKENNEGATGLDAMEAMIREKTDFSIQRTEETKINNAPNDKPNKLTSAEVNVNNFQKSIKNRANFLLNDLFSEVDGENEDDVMGVLRGTGNTIDEALITEAVITKFNDGNILKNKKGTTVKTGWKWVGDDKVYTLVLDKNKFNQVQAIFEQGSNRLTRSKTVKAEKFNVTTIKVNRNNPRAGMAEINAWMNALNPSKQSIGAVDLLNNIDLELEEIKNTKKDPSFDPNSLN